MLHRKNSIVQKRLYDNMDDLLQLDVAIPDMAEVLTEVREFIQYFGIYIIKSSGVMHQLWISVIHYHYCLLYHRCLRVTRRYA